MIEEQTVSTNVLNPPETKTLRDEMAMAALIGFISAQSNPNVPMMPQSEELAGAAYKIADSMMKERNRNDR